MDASPLGLDGHRERPTLTITVRAGEPEHLAQSLDLINPTVPAALSRKHRQYHLAEAPGSGEAQCISSLNSFILPL